jgi:hypothetical protein
MRNKMFRNVACFHKILLINHYMEMRKNSHRKAIV